MRVKFLRYTSNRKVWEYGSHAKSEHRAELPGVLEKEKQMEKVGSKALWVRAGLSLLLACSLGLISLTGCASGDGGSQSQNTTNTQQEAPAAYNAASETVTLVVQDPDNEGSTLSTEEVALAEGGTVYDALEASTLETDIQDSQYGKFLNAIGDKATEGNGGWVYTVNGEEVMESIDSCALNPGDTVEFEYIVFS